MQCLMLKKRFIRPSERFRTKYSLQTGQVEAFLPPWLCIKNKVHTICPWITLSHLFFKKIILSFPYPNIETCTMGNFPISGGQIINNVHRDMRLSVFADHVSSYRHELTFWKTAFFWQKIRLWSRCKTHSAVNRILSFVACLKCFINSISVCQKGREKGSMSANSLIWHLIRLLVLPYLWIVLLGQMAMGNAELHLEAEVQLWAELCKNGSTLMAHDFHHALEILQFNDLCRN